MYLHISNLCYHTLIICTCKYAAKVRKWNHPEPFTEIYLYQNILRFYE